MIVEELAALAATGASALIGAMASDAWKSFRDTFARALGHNDPERIEILQGRLEESHLTLTQLSGHEREKAALQQEAAWRARIADSLEENPDLAIYLREALNRSSQLKLDSLGSVTQKSIAFDRSQQAVQGHGQQINTFNAERGE